MPDSRGRFSRRLSLYLIGLLVYAFGACLMTKANVGISPITSVSYVGAQITGVSLGTATFVMNLGLILIQILLLGRRYEKRQLVQILVSVAFSVFVDLTMLLADHFAYDFLAGRIAVFAASLVIMALGISLLLMANLFLLPGDGVAQAISRRWGMEFGRAKVLTDCCMVAATVVLSLAALGRVIGIQVGTVITALALGNLARLVIRWIGGPVRRLLDPDAGRREEEAC